MKKVHTRFSVAKLVRNENVWNVYIDKGRRYSLTNENFRCKKEIIEMEVKRSDIKRKIGYVITNLYNVCFINSIKMVFRGKV